MPWQTLNIGHEASGCLCPCRTSGGSTKQHSRAQACVTGDRAIAQLRCVPASGTARARFRCCSRSAGRYVWPSSSSTCRNRGALTRSSSSFVSRQPFAMKKISHASLLRKFILHGVLSQNSALTTARASSLSSPKSNFFRLVQASDAARARLRCCSRSAGRDNWPSSSSTCRNRGALTRSSSSFVSRQPFAMKKISHV